MLSKAEATTMLKQSMSLKGNESGIYGIALILRYWLRTFSPSLGIYYLLGYVIEM